MLSKVPTDSVLYGDHQCLKRDFGAEGGAHQSKGNIENAQAKRDDEAAKRAPLSVEVGGKQKPLTSSGGVNKCTKCAKNAPTWTPCSH